MVDLVDVFDSGVCYGLTEFVGYGCDVEARELGFQVGAFAPRMGRYVSFVL